MYFGEYYSAEVMYDGGLVSYLVDDNNFEEFVLEKATWLGNNRKILSKERLHPYKKENLHLQENK